MKSLMSFIVPPDPATTTPMAGRPQSALAAYARVWAAHTALQLHSQPFLLPNGWRTPLLLLLLVLALQPTRSTFTAAMLARNAARFFAMPFVWDSEFWLALTDASVLLSMGWQKKTGSLPHVGRWVCCQLAICYAATALLKLNSSFLNPTTSCAPIFGLSLLERVPMAARLLAARPFLLRAYAAAMPGANSQYARRRNEQNHVAGQRGPPRLAHGPVGQR